MLHLMISLTGICLLTCIYIGIHLRGKSGTIADVRLRNFFLKSNIPFLYSSMRGITKFGNVETLFIIAMPILFYLIHQGSYVTASSIIIACSTAVLTVNSMKIAFRRSRPHKDKKSINYIGYSFPSGHSAMGMSFYITLAYILFDNSRSLILILILAFCLGLLIAASRVILGVHWLSDVLVGSIIGLFCSFWSIYAYQSGFYFHQVFG